MSNAVINVIPKPITSGSAWKREAKRSVISARLYAPFSSTISYVEMAALTHPTSAQTNIAM